jgi:hypothetical protein
MCCISNLYYVLYFFNFYAICLLKFIVHRMNFEIVKFGIVKLTQKEKVDVVNVDVTVS